MKQKIVAIFLEVEQNNMYPILFDSYTDFYEIVHEEIEEDEHSNLKILNVYPEYVLTMEETNNMIEEFSECYGDFGSGLDFVKKYSRGQYDFASRFTQHTPTCFLFSIERNNEQYRRQINRKY